jgi:hypothetical protein
VSKERPRTGECELTIAVASSLMFHRSLIGELLGDELPLLFIKLVRVSLILLTEEPFPCWLTITDFLGDFMVKSCNGFCSRKSLDIAGLRRLRSTAVF